MSSFSSFQNSKLGLGKFKNSYFELFSGFNSKILNAINLELGNLELGKKWEFWQILRLESILKYSKFGAWKNFEFFNFSIEF